MRPPLDGTPRIRTRTRNEQRKGDKKGRRQPAILGARKKPNHKIPPHNSTSRRGGMKLPWNFLELPGIYRKLTEITGIYHNFHELPGTPRNSPELLRNSPNSSVTRRNSPRRPELAGIPPELARTPPELAGTRWNAARTRRNSSGTPRNSLELPRNSPEFFGTSANFEEFP